MPENLPEMVLRRHVSVFSTACLPPIFAMGKICRAANNISQAKQELSTSIEDFCALD